MKKLLVIILLVVAGAGLYFYRAQIFSKVKLNEPANLSADLLSLFNNENFLPPPLKSLSQTTSGTLTKAGVITQTNLQRKNNGNLPALKENSKLDAAAKLKLDDMFAKQYFEHISPSGVGPSDLANKVGYAYVIVGENLAEGNFASDAALLEAWMNSPGHRANILNVKFQEIGVAVGQGTFEGNKVWMAVQEFGAPLSACPAVDQSLKTQIEDLRTQVSILKAEIDQKKSELDSYRGNPGVYNQKVQEYNALVDEYNNLVDRLKALVNQYNAQVNAFNACVGS